MLQSQVDEPRTDLLKKQKLHNTRGVVLGEIGSIAMLKEGAFSVASTAVYLTTQPNFGVSTFGTENSQRRGKGGFQTTSMLSKCGPQTRSGREI